MNIATASNSRRAYTRLAKGLSVYVLIAGVAIGLYFPLTVGMMAQMVGQLPIHPSLTVQLAAGLAIALSVAIVSAPAWSYHLHGAERTFWVLTGLVLGGFAPVLFMLGIGLLLA